MTDWLLGGWWFSDRVGAARRRVVVASGEEPAEPNELGEQAPQPKAAAAGMPRRCRRREKNTILLRLVVLVATMLSLQVSALAQPGDGGRARAMEKFKAGSAAYSEGRHKDAIDLFVEADNIAPHPAFAFNASMAYEGLKDYSNALRWARTYLRRDPDAPDRLDVLAKITAHQDKLAARGLQQVTVISNPPGATLHLDGKPIGVTPWTGDIPPGSHELKLRKDGHDKALHRFELPAKQAIDVVLTLAITAQPAAPLPLPTSKPDPIAAPTPAPPQDTGTSESSPVLLYIGIGLGTVGVAGLAAALGLESARGSAEDDARNASTQLDAEQQADDMESFRLGARIALGVGAVLTVGGVTLIVFNLSSDDDPLSAVEMGCGAWGCGPVWRGAF